MKTYVLYALVLINISGCVGYTFSKNSDVVINPGISPMDLQYFDKKPNRVADKINPDGSEMFVLKDVRKWCGLTVFAIIPIPLWLPVCHDRTEHVYRDGKLIQISRQWPVTSGFGCGPYMGFGGGPQDFCQ